MAVKTFSPGLAQGLAKQGPGKSAVVKAGASSVVPPAKALSVTPAHTKIASAPAHKPDEPAKAAKPNPAPAPVTANASAPVPTKSAAPVPAKTAAPLPTKTASPVPTKPAAPVPTKSAAPVPTKAENVTSKSASEPNKAAPPVRARETKPASPASAAATLASTTTQTKATPAAPAATTGEISLITKPATTTINNPGHNPGVSAPSVKTDAIMKNAEHFVAFSQANVEALMKSSQIWTAGLQGLSKQMAANAQLALDETVSTLKAMTAVKSVKEAIDLQTNLARVAVEKAVAGTTQITDASMKLAEETIAPITERFQAAAQSFSVAA
jgi:phasin family protein